jgi:DNA adenine methylase
MVILMRSPLCYVGGKSRLAKSIIEEMPDHETYAEVFAGGCWVLFTKEPSRYEAINDIHSDLVAFWRVIRHHIEEFCKQFRFLLVSREWFEDYKRQAEAGGLTDIQRAARFYYLQRCGFGGKVVGRVFGGGPLRHPRINLMRMEEELSEVHMRLTHVLIEHLPWDEFIRRYDRPSTLFYLDPPYHGYERYYGEHFARPDFVRVADLLATIQGKFVLSINDVPEIREVFKAFRLRRVKTAYSLAKDTSKQVSELVIRNF